MSLNTLFVEFDALMTIDSLNTALICPAIFPNATQCTVVREEGFTRLMAINVFYDGPKFDLAYDIYPMLVTWCEMDPSNSVVFTSARGENVGLQLLFSLLLSLFSLSVILLVCFGIHRTQITSYKKLDDTV